MKRSELLKNIAIRTMCDKNTIASSLDLWKGLKNSSFLALLETKRTNISDALSSRFRISNWFLKTCLET